MFLLVEFKGNEVGVVPASWSVDDHQVRWPTYKSSTRIMNAVKRQEPPSDDWSLEPIVRIMYQNENYDCVREKLKLAEEVSDLQSEGEEERGNKRKRKPAYKLVAFDSSEDDLPAKSVNASAGGMQLPVAPPKLPLNSSTTETVRNSTSPRESSLRQTKGPGPSGAGHQGSMDVIMSGITQILTSQEKFREEMKEMRRMIHQLAMRQPMDVAAAMTLPEAIQFPISSIEEMETMDDLLRDPDTLTLVTKHLQTFCGTNVREIVFRIMKEAVTNTVATSYNLKGLKQKRPFQQLQLMAVLYSCLSRNPTTRTATKKEVETEVQKWLSGARDREGGRKDRAQKDRPALDITDDQRD